MSSGNNDDILDEIERLKAEKEKLERRISQLEAQLSGNGNCDAAPAAAAAIKDSASNGDTPACDGGGGLTPEMIFRYSRHLLLPNFGVEGIFIFISSLL